MTPADARARSRRRAENRVSLLRRRLAVVSATAFVAFFVLAAQHAVGTTKRRVAMVTGRRVEAAPAVVTYFDQHDDGYAFADAAPAAPAPADQSSSSSAAQPPLPPPPVAQTSAS